MSPIHSHNTSSVHCPSLFSRVILGSWPTQTLVICFAAMTGLSICAYFHQIRCDPIESGDITSTNQVPRVYNNEHHQLPWLMHSLSSCFLTLLKWDSSLSTASRDWYCLRCTVEHWGMVLSIESLAYSESDQFSWLKYEYPSNHMSLSPCSISYIMMHVYLLYIDFLSICKPSK